MGPTQTNQANGMGQSAPTAAPVNTNNTATATGLATAAASVAPSAPQENMMATGVSAKKSGKGMVIGLILCLLSAAGGIGFGVWAMMDGNQQKDQLNEQITALKTQNNELLDKLSEPSTQTEDTTTGDEVYSNPVIASQDTDLSYVISFNSTAIGQLEGARYKLHLGIKDGMVEACDIVQDDTTGGESRACEITGLNGNIYKVVEFGRGQDKTMNKIGFIMSDGTVQYLSLSDAIDNGNYAIQGALKIDGFVTDAISVQEVAGTVGGGFSTVFVLRNGSLVNLTESMF